MLIPHVVIRVDGSRIDADVKTVRRNMLRVKNNRSLQSFERTLAVDTKIFDLEGDRRSLVDRKERMRRRLCGQNAPCQLCYHKSDDISHTHANFRKRVSVVF